MAKLVDIGANLTNRRFQKDLPQVLQRAASAGLDAILVTGTSLRASQEALELVRRMQHKSGGVALFTTVGVHPHDAKDFDPVSSAAEMRALVVENPGTVVAVGESGLDFNRDFSPRDVQERVFRAQVELACELKLPLFLHERDAHATFVSVLQPFLDAKRLPPVVVHCFTGSESELRTYIQMGFYIGLTGFVCMDSRGFKLRTMAASIPTDKLMIETDAPFMYPYGNNVKARCEPKDLRAVAQTLAECYHVALDEIAATTTANAKRFFQLDQCLALRSAAAAAPRSSQPHHPRNSKSSHHSLQKAPNHNPDYLEQKKSPPAPPAPVHDEDLVVLNGGHGEGGGQVLRISVGLASVLQKAIRVHSIRANRKVPGLRNQHVHTIQLARELAVGSTLEGAQLNATEIRYVGAGASSSKHCGDRTLEATSQTGGSVSLMIQGSLPILVFSGGATTLKLRGGTHAGFSPPVDFMEVPLKQLLARFGVATTLEIKRRGFFIGDVGEIEYSVKPVAPGTSLSPVDLSVFSSAITKLYARVTVVGSSANESVGQQYVRALQEALSAKLAPFGSLSDTTETTFDVRVEVTRTKSAKGKARTAPGKRTSASSDERPAIGLLVVAETTTGGLLSVDRSGKLSPPAIASQVADVLAQHVAAGVCVDEHLADNAVVFMALASGVSRLRVPAKAVRTSQHLETALEIVQSIAGARVSIEEGETSAVVEVHGIGFVVE